MKRFLIIAAAMVLALAPEAHAERFKTTGYCACRKCCGKWADGKTATGTTATAGRTVAVDKKVIPLGSIVTIDGVDYVAEDTGVKGHVIDVFYGSHDEALGHGVQWVDVKITEATE